MPTLSCRIEAGKKYFEIEKLLLSYTAGLPHLPTSLSLKKIAMVFIPKIFSIAIRNVITAGRGLHSCCLWVRNERVV